MAIIESESLRVQAGVSSSCTTGCHGPPASACWSGRLSCLSQPPIAAPLQDGHGAAGHVAAGESFLSPKPSAATADKLTVTVMPVMPISMLQGCPASTEASHSVSDLFVTEAIVHRQDGMLRCFGCCRRTRAFPWDQPWAVF